MDTGSLRNCFERMDSLPGWFFPDAALMFMAYNQLVSDRGVRGNTLEIGVYHGKSAIAVASLRGESGTFTAIDVFDDLQSRDGSSHDVGIKGAFLANMAASFPTLDWVRRSSLRRQRSALMRSARTPSVTSMASTPQRVPSVTCSCAPKWWSPVDSSPSTIISINGSRASPKARCCSRDGIRGS